MRLLKSASHADKSSSLVKTFVSKNKIASGSAATFIESVSFSIEQSSLGKSHERRALE